MKNTLEKITYVHTKQTQETPDKLDHPITFKIIKLIENRRLELISRGVYETFPDAGHLVNWIFPFIHILVLIIAFKNLEMVTC